MDRTADSTTGLAPTVTDRVNDRDEAEAAARWVVGVRAGGTPWRDVLVVAPGKRKWRERIAKALDGVSVPHRMLLGEPGATRDPEADVVHVVSLYGAEGLSAPAVAVVGLGDLPWKQQPLDEAVRVVVACLEVATERLEVSSSRPSTLVDALVSNGYIARK